MRLTNYLTERSYTQQDIPKRFRVAIDIKYHDNAINDMAKMKLKGVTGISSSGEIIYDFFGIGRDAFLVMDAKEVIKKNKLSRFMYDNPHYFFSKDMEHLKRMYNKQPSDNRGTWHNLADKIFYEFRRRGLIDEWQMKANAPGQAISYTNIVKTSTVNSIKDAVKVFKKALKEVVDKPARFGTPYNYFADYLDIPNKTLEDIIYKAFIEDIGNVYKSEGEWEVKSGILEIPNKSYLYILTNFTDDIVEKYNKGEFGPFEKMRYETPLKEELAMKKEIEKKLGGKYIIKYINERNWSSARAKHFDRKYK